MVPGPLGYHIKFENGRKSQENQKYRNLFKFTVISRISYYWTPHSYQPMAGIMVIHRVALSHDRHTPLQELWQANGQFQNHNNPQFRNP